MPLGPAQAHTVYPKNSRNQYTKWDKNNGVEPSIGAKIGSPLAPAHVSSGGHENGYNFYSTTEPWDTIWFAKTTIDDSGWYMEMALPYQSLNFDAKRDTIAGLGNDRVNALIEKLKNHCTNEKWTAAQAKNVAAFAKSLPGEMMVSLWNGISATQQMHNIHKMHMLIGLEVV